MLARDIGELVAGGLARHVEPASVVVLAPEAILHAGRAFSPDEPARHKLLDLLGDLYLSGGPPLGRLRAVRPGHAANAVAAQARARGGDRHGRLMLESGECVRQSSRSSPSPPGRIDARARRG